LSRSLGASAAVTIGDVDAVDDGSGSPPRFSAHHSVHWRPTRTIGLSSPDDLRDPEQAVYRNSVGRQPVTRNWYAFHTDLREMRNQTMLFVFGLGAHPAWAIRILIWPHRQMALSVRGNPMMGGLKKIRPGFLDEGTKISLVPRGPIKYPSSGGHSHGTSGGGGAQCFVAQAPEDAGGR
jgi:hypothetical protein